MAQALQDEEALPIAPLLAKPARGASLAERFPVREKVLVGQVEPKVEDDDVRQAPRVGKNLLRFREGTRMEPVAARPRVRDFEKGQLWRQSREELRGPRLIVDDEDARRPRHAAGPTESVERTSRHSPRLSSWSRRDASSRATSSSDPSSGSRGRRSRIASIASRTRFRRCS